MNTLPTLTTEQRRANLERAKEARRARAELRRDLKTGRIAPADALDDPRAQRLYVPVWHRSARAKSCVVSTSTRAVASTASVPDSESG